MHYFLGKKSQCAHIVRATRFVVSGFPVDSGSPFVDSGSPFVDSGTHFVDSETHFVDSGRQNGDCHSKKNRDQWDYISVRAGHLRTHLKTRTNAANATLPLFGLLL